LKLGGTEVDVRQRLIVQRPVLERENANSPPTLSGTLIRSRASSAAFSAAFAPGESPMFARHCA
jgi:hypothetical protein